TLPGDAYCNRHPSDDYTIYCTTADKGNSVYFVYSTVRHMIVDIAASGHDKTIGELIVAWGMPTGAKYSELGAQVYWGTRSVYLVTTDFNPGTPVNYVSYSLEPHAVPAWMGFISR